MERRLSSYIGCLLGLAAGDGLGHGPERLNGFLPTSAYTQLAAFHVVPDYDLSIMKEKQTLFDITTNILNRI
ncbi:MAG: hypothetical protein J6I89_07420, partial [Oscillospiraceae bacterium]|nr:hypothetical protein [Oscillospiraceae bacterium]